MLPAAGGGKPMHFKFAVLLAMHLQMPLSTLMLLQCFTPCTFSMLPAAGGSGGGGGPPRGLGGGAAAGDGCPAPALDCTSPATKQTGTECVLSLVYIANFKAIAASLCLHAPAQLAGFILNF